MMPSASSPRRPTLRLALAAALAAATLGSATEAGAYCRTSVCNGEVAGTLCVPAQSTDCGIPLFWARSCIGISLQQDGTNQVALSTVETVVRDAFTSWQQADCGGATPGIGVLLAERVACDEVEYNKEGGNANIVMFRDEVWPHAGMGNTLALTTVTYNLDSAEIFDADMEVNSTPATVLTVGDTGVQFDLLSILTHEAGHVLGIAHSEDESATMAANYIPGDISIRELSPDDEAAICAAYAPKNIGECDITPRHGFKKTCGPGPPEEDCECTVANVNRRTPLHWAGLFALGALVWARRRHA